MATLDQGVLPRALSLQPPGKINLTLRVLGGREDGFHELESFVIGVGLLDSIRAVSSEAPGISFACDDCRISESDNLMRRAVDALMRRGCAPQSGMRIELSKRIPVGAGLGGGSSDAAATLRVCNLLWDAGLSDGALAEVGASIGSDVPVFFHLPVAVMRGRGERVEATALGWRGWALLLTPGFSLDTGSVYQAWRPQDSAGDRPSVEGLARCTNADELSEHLFNDLEPAAFRVRPELREVRNALARYAGGALRVTGSGSTIFRLYDDYQEAISTAKRINEFIPGISVAVVEAPVAAGDPKLEE